MPGSRAARASSDRPRRFRLRAIPWELPVLAAAAIVFVLIERGGGLVRIRPWARHPRLIVLCFPLFLSAGVTGLVLRIVRPLLRLPRPRRDAFYLAVRRLAAARTLLVLLTVTASVSFCALTFAEILGRSLHASSVEKAYVANGSDVQGLIDPEQPPPRSFPFPITKVEEAFGIAHLDDGSPVEILAVDPRTLAQVVPRQRRASSATRLRRFPLSRPRAQRTYGPSTRGQAPPLHVVATVRSFPGMVSGDPSSSCRKQQLVRRIPFALGNANAYLWVRGDAAKAQRALEHIMPAPSFVTTVDYFLQNADLSTADRTYGFLRVIALGAAASRSGAPSLSACECACALVTSAFLGGWGCPLGVRRSRPRSKQPRSSRSPPCRRRMRAPRGATTRDACRPAAAVCAVGDRHGSVAPDPRVVCRDRRARRRRRRRRKRGCGPR